MEYRNTRDATENVQLPEEANVLSSSIASESETGLIYLSRLFGFQGEDWLTEVTILEERDDRRHKPYYKNF